MVIRRRALHLLGRGVVVMAASTFSGEHMAAALQDRLSKMDQAIDLLQGLRRETASLVAELFPEVA